MSTFDTLSPLAPAHVRVLVLPAGRIKRQRFRQFFNELKKVGEVRLGDVTPDPRPDRTLFSPLHAPEAKVVYDFANVAPSDTHLSLSPFEIFHEPCVVIGLVDAAEYAVMPAEDGNLQSSEIGKFNSQLETWQSLHQELTEKHTGALLHKVIVFGVGDEQRQLQGQGDIMSLPPLDQFRSTTMMTTICDLTAAVLSEMTTSVRSIQALPVVPSPDINRSTYQRPNPEAHAEDAKITRVQSLANGRARSASPSTRDDPRSHRMSMPVLTTGAEGALPHSDRPATPESQQAQPARTFDDITGATGRPVVQRTLSANRVSVTGFGSGGHDEWNRNRGKVRVGVVCAFRFLQAGRWTEALRQFTENGTKARAYGDHIWHAKALEGALYAMLLLAWAKMEFHIPSICQHTSDRPLSGKGNSVVAPKSSLDGLSGPPATLQDLQSTLSELIYMILTIYQRSRSGSADALPALCFAEVSIRLGGILAALHLSNGLLNSTCLRHIVTGIGAQDHRHQTSRFGVIPSRLAISNIVLAALPDEDDGLVLYPSDKLELLAGITSLFSHLGLQRKKAFILKTYLETLIQIIKAGGTAEVGAEIAVQRASNLHQYGLRAILEELYMIYGIDTTRTKQRWEHADSEGPAAQLPIEPSVEKIAALAIHDDAYGNIAIKADVLRVFVQLCYDLPDIGSAMQYISTFLRVVGPQIAVSADNSDAVVALSSEEQSALSNALTESALDPMHDTEVRPEYWDRFLVRGLYVLDPRAELRLHKQRRDRLSGARQIAQTVSSAKKGPFLYSAFEKTETTDESNLLVVGEDREFVVSLQNPYDFEVTLLSLKIMAGNTLIAQSIQQLLLRSNRIQSFSVIGKVSESGDITVDSCLIEVRGCRESRFPIFTEAWTPVLDQRIKNIGLIHPEEVQENQGSSTEDAAHRASAVVNASKLPKESSIPMVIVPPQPVLKITSVSINNGALMLLEGQTIQFKVSIHNIANVDANLIIATCQDSASSSLLEAAKTKGIQPSEMFAYEEDLASPALRIADPANTIESIPAKSSGDFVFTITGRPGLSTATILFDYASLDEEEKSTIRTRQISLPFKVTVNASAHITRCDVLPLMDDFRMPAFAGQVSPGPMSAPLSISHVTSSLTHKIERVEDSYWYFADCISQDSVYAFPSSAFSLLVLDVRNAWPTPLVINVSCSLDSKLLGIDNAESLGFWGTSQTIQPGHIERILIPIPRIYIENSLMNVQRALRTANERQFIISSVGNLHPDTERTQRQLFWHRLILARILRATWTTQDYRHKGMVPLNGLQLLPRTLNAFQEHDISIDMQVVPETEDTDVIGLDESKAQPSTVKVGRIVTLRTTLQNRTNHRTIWPLLHLHPALAHDSNSQQPADLSKYLAWSGALQQPLKALSPGQSVEVDIPLCALCTGEFVITASIEEMKPAKSTINEEQAAEKWSDGLHGIVLDEIANGVGRRNWTSARVCRIVAEDDDVG